MVLGLAGAAILIYAIDGGKRFTDRATSPTQLDTILGVIFILLLLGDAADHRVDRSGRGAGVHRLFLLRPYLPQPWTRGFDIGQLVGHLFITLEGLFGVPVDVSSSLIILFTIYGSFLQLSSGAGKFFIDFSMALMGNKHNSAGRTVVLSSFLLGGPSGSGVATTVTIGAVAYPMMQRAGFEKNAAGGLLAAGGLGAIISPPVLGAAAFLIAEFLKISYLEHDMDGCDPDLPLLHVAAVHGPARRQTVRRAHRRHFAGPVALAAHLALWLPLPVADLDHRVHAVGAARVSRCSGPPC